MAGECCPMASLSSTLLGLPLCKNSLNTAAISFNTPRHAERRTEASSRGDAAAAVSA